jgi:transcriptional regulator with XRE-family HTH domain
MSESFGARMRQQREQQQIALTTIAEQTKIQLSLLEAMERDDMSRWPSGIFRRAFIRAYARAIGLDTDAVVREFLEKYPDPLEAAAEAQLGAAPTGETDGTATSGPPTRLRYVVGSAMAYLSRRRVDAGVVAAVETEVPGPAPEDIPVDVNQIADGPEPDLVETARLCTAIGRIGETGQAAPHLEDMARMLNAVGVVVWQWEPQTRLLRPALACGYSDLTVAQLPDVTCEADNATAAAFRSARIYTVTGIQGESGALVVPMMTDAGCVGVLAAELPEGSERNDSVRAVLTIVAAQLARVAGGALSAEAAYRQAV